MKTLLLAFAIQCPLAAHAKESAAQPVAQPAAVVPAVVEDSIRTLGRLNVNTATREQLLTVPGLDAATVDDLLRERSRSPIVDLAALRQLSDEALTHLKTSGASDIRRIRQLPLVRLDQSPASASR
jgi:DNA uptake protein ComE-like DNA-binding protein